MDVSLMKKYLTNIFNLESDLYAMRKLREELINEINALRSYAGQQNVVADLEYFELSDVVEIVKGIASGGLGLGFFGGIISLLLGYNPEGSFAYLKTIFIRGPLIGLCIGTLVGIVFSIILKIGTEKDNFKKIRYVEEENYRIDKNNSAEKIDRNSRANIILDEVNILDQKIRETNDVLNKYYNCNLIYVKYRNYVAVASFLEYFMSGRCTALEGHEGAYNIFENELRQNIIIGKLDDVIECLDRIEQNQYILYSEIRNQNNKINTLKNGINSCANSLRKIETSSQATAYNSEISARNTECLTWLAILS